MVTPISVYDTPSGRNQFRSVFITVDLTKNSEIWLKNVRRTLTKTVVGKSNGDVISGL